MSVRQRIFPFFLFLSLEVFDPTKKIRKGGGKRRFPHHHLSYLFNIGDGLLAMERRSRQFQKPSSLKNFIKEVRQRNCVCHLMQVVQYIVERPNFIFEAGRWLQKIKSTCFFK